MPKDRVPDADDRNLIPDAATLALTISDASGVAVNLNQSVGSKNPVEIR